jgi:hypothetical protein
LERGEALLKINGKCFYAKVIIEVCLLFLMAVVRFPFQLLNHALKHLSNLQKYITCLFIFCIRYPPKVTTYPFPLIIPTSSLTSLGLPNSKGGRTEVYSIPLLSPSPVVSSKAHSFAHVQQFNHCLAWLEASPHSNNTDDAVRFPTATSTLTTSTRK